MIHEVRAAVKWRVRSNLPREEIERLATETLLRALSSAEIPRFDIRVSSTHSREDYRVIKEMSWLDSVDRIYRSKNSLPVKDRNKSYQAKMNPQRFFLFRENRFCICCGVEGDKLLVEIRDSDKSPHLNLYANGMDGLTLMTRDHVQPKSLGGCDHLSNYQTMCSVCNSLKGHSNIRLSELKRLRKFYDAHRGKPKQDLHHLVESERHRISVPWSFGPHQSQAHIRGVEAPAHKTLTDLSVYRSDNGTMMARAVCSKAEGCGAYIGNIRRGMVFGALFSYRREVECQVGTSAVLIPKSLLKRVKAKGVHEPARKRDPSRKGNKYRHQKRNRSVSAPGVDRGAAAGDRGNGSRIQEGGRGPRLVRSPLQGGKGQGGKAPSGLKKQAGKRWNKPGKPAGKAGPNRGRGKKDVAKGKNTGHLP